MKHYGDITKLSGYDLPAVDVITGGSPCQDLSVAGKRDGLDGERSGLFMDQIRIIKEMREHGRGSNGGADKPVRAGRYCIWENVPGAFSSNGGRDFQAVLTEFVRVAQPQAPDVPLPDKGGWPSAGCLVGMGADGQSFSLAWRVHDAQYWGVPQRRKRLCVLVDYCGLTAPWILFDPQYERTSENGNPVSVERHLRAESRPEVPSVREGVSGYSEPGGTSGEGTSSGTETGAGGASYTLVVRVQACDVYNQTVEGDVAPTVTAATGGANTSGPKVLTAGFKPRQSSAARTLGWQSERSPTIQTDQNYAVFNIERNGNE